MAASVAGAVVSVGSVLKLNEDFVSVLGLSPPESQAARPNARIHARNREMILRVFFSFWSPPYF